jgi:hypothetical protein
MTGPNPNATERRTTGGRENPLSSLTHLLESARRRAAAEALSLADDTGILIAGAGPCHDCELLAALSPLTDARLPANDVVPTRIDVLSATVVRRVRIDGVEVLLSARGGDDRRDEALSHAIDGIRRILGTRRRRVRENLE